MSTARRALLITAGVAATVALAYTLLSLQYRWGTMSQPGTAFYPFWIGIFFLTTAVGVGWEAWRDTSMEAIDWPRGQSVMRVLAVVGASIGYAILLVLVGHAVAATAVAFGLMTVMGARRYVVTGALALVVGFGSAFLFIDVLSVPLPPGVLFA